MSKSLYEFAQDALAMGIHVFPLGVASKYTVTAHGFKDSETEPVVIRGWWVAHPGYNVGVDCGASVLAVVDIDSGLHSREEFDAWFAASGLPPTYTVHTGRRWEKIIAPCGGGCKDANGTPRQINYVPWEKGSADDMWVPSVGKGNYTTVGRCEHCGWSGKIHSVEPKVPAYGAQLYYRGTMRSSGAGKFQLNGCTGEVKSIGGYVVGAGSIHPDSLEPYEVICGGPFAELPTLVGESVTKAKTTTSATNGTGAAVQPGGKIQTGNRNNAAISCAGKLFSAGITAAPDLFLSLQAWSRSNCDPPLGDAELLDIATRAAATFEPAVDTTVSPDWTTPEAEAVETAEDVAGEINDILREPGLSAKNPGGKTEREKEHLICLIIHKHLKANGKLFNCGNVATFVDNKKREIIQITKGNPHFTRLLMRYGVFPADKLTMAIGMFLGGIATTAAENTIYAMSFYNRDKHILYVNEYEGNFLKIDGTGAVTRMRNGDDNMLFSDGKDSQCEPLAAELADVRSQAILCGPLSLDSGPGLIKSEILDTINYSEDGIGKESSQLILLLCILALYFPERIPSMPQTFLLGQGASMKTSLAVKVGKLIQGPKFAARPATDDVKELKDMAISLPFLVLDEANQVRKLTNALKVIATGGIDHRRELYTTAEMRCTPYQARIWMTANTDSLTNETITSRLMIIDAAARTEAEPYCSEHYLVWSEDERNAIWTELVGRLSAAMRDLTLADAKGEGNLHVAHRMSSFFVFGRALARERCLENKLMGAMNAMSHRQSNASAQDNEILSLISRCPASYNIKGKAGMRTAEDWALIFTILVPEANYELRGKVSRPAWVRNAFMANAGLLKERAGLVEGTTLTNQNNKIKVYGFKFGCCGREETMEDELGNGES
jgi:hypothetical protein